MPEPPDFDAIARRVIDETTRVPTPINSHMIEGIVYYLRQVWNARGAADIAKVTTELSDEGSIRERDAQGKYTDRYVVEPYIKSIGRALRSLDR